jgi:hypothetical protein
VAVADPDVERPGVVGHLLVEKRLDSHEVLVGLEEDLLDVKTKNLSNRSNLNFNLNFTSSVPGTLQVSSM